jgi:DNA-binding NarL/FixJ family response regulator
MNSIRLLVIEDNRLLREGIVAMAEIQPDIKVIGAIGDSERTFQKIKKLKPHIVLLDLGLRNENSLRLVESVKEQSLRSKIIVMDLFPMQADIYEFVKAGVSGFILKDASVEDFLSTIRLVANGAKVLPPHLTESLFSQIVDHAVNSTHIAPSRLVESVRMTKRERQVINLISDGMTNKEIAQKLHLSTYTVKSHVHNILEKLALHTRVQIARYAHRVLTLQDVEDRLSLPED